MLKMFQVVSAELFASLLAGFHRCILLLMIALLLWKQTLSAKQEKRKWKTSLPKRR